MSILVIPVSLTPTVNCFGYAGHFIIGEVASGLLKENVRDRIAECDLLGAFNGSMGQASVWADNIKRLPNYRWTSPLHYYDVDNDPPSDCGSVSSIAPGHNLLSFLTNATYDMMDAGKRCPSHFRFRMLIHLLQDLHQPLHLTGKARGGNEIRFEKEGRIHNLHRYWDSEALNELLRRKLSSPTLNNAIGYFSERVSRQQSLDSSRCLDCLNFLHLANTLVQENCNLVWCYNDPAITDYVTDSTVLIEKLMVSAMIRSAAILNIVLSPNELLQVQPKT